MEGKGGDTTRRNWYIQQTNLQNFKELRAFFYKEKIRQEHYRKKSPTIENAISIGFTSITSRFDTFSWKNTKPCPM